MNPHTELLAQIEAVRRSGKTNMMDKTTVQRIAYECDYFALVNFIEDCSNGDYMEAIQEAPSYFDNRKAGLPIEEVPETLTYTTTVSL